MLDARIQAALDSHEPINVVYNGGSQPGVVRTITPIGLNGTMLRARCHVTGTAKMFKVARLAIAGDGQPSYSTAPPPQFQSVREVMAFYVDTLASLNLAVDWSSSEGEEALTVHKRFKNGKAMKGSIAGLSFSPFVENWYMDMDGDELVEMVQRHLTDKPWLVSSKTMTTARFKHLDKAAKKFIDGVMSAKD